MIILECFLINLVYKSPLMTKKSLLIFLCVFSIFISACSNNTKSRIDKLEDSINKLSLIKLKGEDTSNDLLREDMKLFINELHINSKQKFYSAQYAREIQRIILQNTMNDCSCLIDSYHRLYQAERSLLHVSFARFGDELVRIIKEKQLNTTNRHQQFNRFLAKANKCLLIN
ncbi:MAG: hypothetical protein UHG91_02815 [Succinivibrionaceae bacterium]|nr:hypothetical protein [Succinivibrionaceae bacterium]